MRFSIKNLIQVWARTSAKTLKRRLYWLHLPWFWCFFFLFWMNIRRCFLRGGVVAYHCELLRKDYSDDEDDDDEDDQRLGFGYPCETQCMKPAWWKVSKGLCDPKGLPELVSGGVNLSWEVLTDSHPSWRLTSKKTFANRNLGGLSQEKSWRQRPTRITTRSKRSPGDGDRWLTWPRWVGLLPKGAHVCLGQPGSGCDILGNPWWWCIASV